MISIEERESVFKQLTVNEIGYFLLICKYQVDNLILENGLIKDIMNKHVRTRVKRIFWKKDIVRKYKGKYYINPNLLISTNEVVGLVFGNDIYRYDNIIKII